MNEGWEWLDRRTTWELKFAIWLRCCVKSNKLIWFTFGYKGTEIIAGPDYPIINHFWLTKDEFTLLFLAGVIKNVKNSSTW